VTYDPLPPRRWHPVVSTLFLFFLLGGCASYHPEPLPEGTDLASRVDLLKTLEENPAANADGSLGLTQVAALAVRNNPDLKVLRKQLGVKHAQLFSEGLLPDPQLSANLDHPTGSAPGAVDAFGLGLNYDVIPLINRSARIDSAREAETQTRLEILWQEWQVGQKARTLAVALAGDRQQIALLRKMQVLYHQRYQHSSRAVARGDLTLDVAGTDLTALLDTLSQINQTEQTLNDTRHALNLLMGLAADAPLEVRLPPPPGTIDARFVHQSLETLAQRRPDLLALRAGYQSQEAKVRAAILSQFPSFSIGITRARDTGSIYTTGFNIGLNLPLFSGNRGAIAIERATRAQLRQEYQARIDEAAANVDNFIRLQGIVAAQQEQLTKYLPTLEKLVERGRSAYRKGDIDALTFLNMESTWIGKRLEQISLDQTQRNNRIALQTLLAWPADAAQHLIRDSEGGQP
jgi:outer membrane protein, heavy metal efflux system